MANIETQAREDASNDERRLNLWTPHATDRFSIDELINAPPQTSFVVNALLPSGCAAALAGAGGGGKTGLVATLSIHIAIDRNIFGLDVDGGSTLHISAEDRRAVFLRHVYSNSRHLSEIELARLKDRLFVKDTVGMGFRLTEHIGGQTEVSEEIGQLIEYANDIKDLKLITLDTLSRLNGGDENNEDLARFVEGMERIARETGAAVLAVHHSGKAQMRSGSNDQYSSRGGSSLSDNARSVMNLARILPGEPNTPSNAKDLIQEGRLLRLSHVKSNYASAVSDIYIERVLMPHAALLREFVPEFSRGDIASVWERVASWLALQTEVKFPNGRTLDTLGSNVGSRSEIRNAVAWAIDRGKLIDAVHPEPKGQRRTYYALPSQLSSAAADDYRRAKDGE